MSRPMSSKDARRLAVRLHGRRFALFAMAEKWVRHLEIYLPIAWDHVRQDLIENMALLEMQRRRSQLPVRDLCEETYVLETIWRLVSNDAYRTETDARRCRLEERMAALQAQLTAHIEAQIQVQNQFEAQLAQLAQRQEETP